LVKTLNVIQNAVIEHGLYMLVQNLTDFVFVICIKRIFLVCKI